MIDARQFATLSLTWACVSSVAALIAVKAGWHSPTVFALKDAPIYLLALVAIKAWLPSKGAVSSMLMMAGAVVLLLLNWFLLNPSYVAPLNNVRQIVAPLALLAIYAKLRLDAAGVSALRRRLCMVVIGVFVFGAVEQAFELWARADLSVFFRLKGIPTDARGLSFMFYEPLFDYHERMTSTFLDPISLGHFFATSALFLYYLRDRSKLEQWALFICMLGLALSISKGAMLQLFLGLTVLNSRVPLVLRGIAIFVPFVVVTLLPSREGIDIHLGGFGNAITTMSLFGYGIGSSGNYAKMFADSIFLYESLGISDTFVGALLGQIGFIGVLAWLGVCAFMLLVSASSRRGAMVSLQLFASIFSVSILSENTMNVTSFLAPAVLIGIAQSAFAKSNATGLRGAGASRARTAA
jgi:hypothetical protein